MKKRKSGFGYLADNILGTTDSVIFRNSFCRICCTSIGREWSIYFWNKHNLKKICNGLVIEMNQIMIGAEMYESVCEDRYVISRFYMHFALVACKGTDEKRKQIQQRKIVKMNRIILLKKRKSLMKNQIMKDQQYQSQIQVRKIQ